MLVEEKDRKLYNALPYHAKMKVDQAEVNMKNIIHWILPEYILRTYFNEECK